MRDRECWFGAALVELADISAAASGERSGEPEYSARVVVMLTELLAPAEPALLMADDAGHLSVVAASTGRAGELLRLEECYGRGPGTTGYLTRRAASNVAIGAWGPEFAVAGREAGFQHVSVLPMRRRDQAIGAACVLSPGVTEVAAVDAVLALLLIEAATIGILQLRELRASHTRAEQLQAALDSRVVIEQAKGVVAATLEMPPAAAFELLRSYARRHNRTLAEVASAIVAGRFAPAGLTPAPGRARAARPGRRDLSP